MNTKPLQALTDLTGKTAIVTGGAVGIGQAVALRLAEAGANVVIADNSETHLATAGEVFADSEAVAFIRCDVADSSDVTSLIDAAVKKFGGIDILVNNAGIFPNNLVMNMTTEDFERVIDVNLKGVFFTTKAVAQVMIDQGKPGKIINVTSIDALHPSTPGLAHYDASKHGVWGFTKNVALELAPHNIWVNAVAPGGIATPGVQEMQQAMQLPEGVDMKKLMESFQMRIPMRRMGEPDDIAKAVLFLASDMASYMTGTQIVVDGGVLLT
jgi:2-deoxy-D-gluconate 3-dehydrogenase